MHHLSAKEAGPLVGDRKNKLMEAAWALMMKRCFPKYDVGKLEVSPLINASFIKLQTQIGRIWKMMALLDEKFLCESCGKDVPVCIHNLFHKVFEKLQKTHLLLHIMEFHQFDKLFYCTQCPSIFVNQV